MQIYYLYEGCEQFITDLEKKLFEQTLKLKSTTNLSLSNNNLNNTTNSLKKTSFEAKELQLSQILSSENSFWNKCCVYFR